MMINLSNIFFIHIRFLIHSQFISTTEFHETPSIVCQFKEEVTAHVQMGILGYAQEICVVYFVKKRILQ